MASRFQTIAGVGAVVGGLCCAQPAVGDVEAYFQSETTYSYTITHVPDFDQRRFLIPNIGSQYCVPTSATNWMAYFANHGADWLAPGPGNWLAQDRYLDGTNAVIDMGILMGTDELNGTTLGGAYNGLNARLPPLLFSVVAQGSNANWTPGFQTASEAVMNGAYCTIAVGWYQEFPFDPDYIDRQGGHMLTLNGGARTGSDMLIRWRDPAADEGSGDPLRLLQQSPFRTHEFEIDRVWRYLADVGGNHRWIDKVVGCGGANQAYIDEVIAIQPNFALTSQPDSPMFVSFNHLYPLWGGVVDDDEYEIAPANEIVDFNLNPDLCSAVFVVEHPGEPRTVWWLNLITREMWPVDYLFDGPRAAFVGPDRALFVQIGNDLVLRMNVDLAEPDVEAFVEAPCPVEAMTYDAAAEKLVLFSASCNTVYRYDRALAGPPEVLPIAGGFPVEPDDCRLAFDPRSGNVWVCSSASESLFELVEAPWGDEIFPEELSMPSIVNPRAFDFGNDGRLFVSSEGVVKEYDYVPDEDRWVEAEEPLFGGAAAHRFLCVSKSSTNFDPDLHTGPDWYDVLPDEDGDEGTPDCVTDLDGDGETGVIDLLAVLAAWGECPAGEFCHPDFDYSGDVDVLDLLAVLGAWGPCP